MYKNAIGIFVDAENTRNPSLIAPIVRTAINSGSVGAVVLFGNWDSPALASWNKPEIKQEFDKFGAVWSTVPKLRPGKNAADIALTYEVTIMVQNGTVNQVWIVSGDSDFTPLVERLQQKQIRVVVFGLRNTPQSLRNACSSFVSLDDVQNGTQTVTISPGASAQSPKLCADSQGWFHGFVKSVGNRFGFIQVSPQEKLFFCADTVDAPMAIHDLRSGDPVEFKIGSNYKGFIAVHVRKTFALRAA
jgi:cold shock CspA family protein